MSNDYENFNFNTGDLTDQELKTKLKKPSMYKVVMLNDDFTPMDFVVYLLKTYFNKPKEEASQIMLQVHKKGFGICGVFTYEIAETKIYKVLDISRKNGHPLQCILEKD